MEVVECMEQNQHSVAKKGFLVLYLHKYFSLVQPLHFFFVSFVKRSHVEFTENTVLTERNKLVFIKTSF